MRVETRLKTYQEVVDRRLGELLPSENDEPKQLHAAMRYLCLAPGKRLRPALCMASGEAVSDATSTKAPVLDAACALEMVHCFSLIDDDLPAIDNDTLRRGAPSCHVKFGEALALLAGDALFSRAYEVLSLADGPGDRVLRAMQSLAKATGSSGLVGGEVLDVLSEGENVSQSQLEEIHSRKTGALISASCEIGALLGNGSEEQVAALKSFGAKIGLAFQIADDLLNELSTEEQLGKSAGSDRERHKATYPKLYGVEGAKAEAEHLLDTATAELTAAKINSENLTQLARYAIERLH